MSCSRSDSFPLPQTDRADFITSYLNDRVVPSTFGEHSHYRHHISSANKDAVALTDRPLSAQPEIPNVLLCGVFRQFLDDIRSTTPSQSDYRFANALRDVMSKLYSIEDQRREDFNHVVSEYMPKIYPHILSDSQWKADGWHTLGTILAAIWEGKLEIGTKGAEPHRQFIQYYTEATFKEARAEPSRRLPLLLGTYYGTSLRYLSDKHWSEKLGSGAYMELDNPHSTKAYGRRCVI